MRIIDESLIPSGDAAYFKQGTWTHLQKAYKEAIDALARAVIKDYDNTKCYILYGCVATGTNPGARTFTAGAVYYAGEVYLVPAASFTTTGSDVAVANITEAFNTTDYSVDPQTTPNGNSISLHVIRTVVLTAGVAGSGDVPDFTAWLDNGVAHEGAYTDISSTVTVNATNFDTTLAKEVRDYEDGTISVAMLLGHSAAVTAGTTVCSGLPTPAGVITVFGVDDISGTVTKHACNTDVGGTALLLLDAISSTNKTFCISFTYKKY